LFRIFYATDVHGSEKCWKKFLNAGKWYKADVVILGGDMTGKAVVPIVKSENGCYKVSFLDQNLTLRSDEEAEDVVKMVSDRGYYPVRLCEREYLDLACDQKAVKALFHEMVVTTMERWMKLADERLSGSGIRCYVCPGNDDMFEVDDIIRSSKTVTHAEGEVAELPEGYVMPSSGWTNPTPWDTPRECSDEDLGRKLEEMLSHISDPSKCIFNFHCPPYGSGLDEAPELDEQLRPKFAGRSLVPVGSHSVKRLVEEYQPVLGLFGHIHESKGVRKLGKTIGINPGSSYEQGLLLGAIVDLDQRGVKQYVLTSG